MIVTWFEMQLKTEEKKECVDVGDHHPPLDLPQHHLLFQNFSSVWIFFDKFVYSWSLFFMLTTGSFSSTLTSLNIFSDHDSPFPRPVRLRNNSRPCLSSPLTFHSLLGDFLFSLSQSVSESLRLSQNLSDCFSDCDTSSSHCCLNYWSRTRKMSLEKFQIFNSQDKYQWQER